MTAEQIAFQLTFASVDADGQGDPTDRAVRILRDERVLAAMRGFDGTEATVLIPVTESGQVVALDTDDRLRFDLSSVRLQELFTAAGLTLHLEGPDVFDAVDADLDEQYGEAFAMLDDQAESPGELDGFGMPDDGELDDEALAESVVLVAEFSRRGPWGARLTAQLLGVDVDYFEAGTWSVYRYGTDRAHGAVSGGRADLPVIEVNIPADGDGWDDAWIEVSGPGGQIGYFWLNSDRLTAPVLDFGSISVPESLEVYRRMLAEADGARDELLGLGLGDDLDLERALRACAPEAVGGTVGARERIREFVSAFGVHEALISAGLDESESGRRFTARGWLRTIADFVMAGTGETLALTRRDRPVPRLMSALRKRPLLGSALSTGELALGVGLSRSRSGFGRAIGILLIIDAIIDLAVWVLRMRRRR